MMRVVMWLPEVERVVRPKVDGLFVGLIQAFVFTTLNMTYIALEVTETD